MLWCPQVLPPVGASRRPQFTESIIDMDRKVVITGMGVIAANGTGKRAFWDAVANGVSGVKPIQSFSTAGYEVHVGAEIPSFKTDTTRNVDRSFQLLEYAVAEAVRDLPSGILDDPDECAQTGVVLGTSQGAILNAAPLHRRFLKPQDAGTDDDRSRFHDYPFGRASHWLADQMGLGGPRTAFSMACVSSSMSVLYGADLIRRGRVRRMIAGGFEAFSSFIFTGFHSLLALDADLCRPFDAQRSGTVLGEGAGIVILEDEQSAIDRGAHIYAEVIGAGCAGDAVHLTAPDRTGQGMARAIHASLVQAGLNDVRDIGYINAHGTGTLFNDAMECAAFQRVFGDYVSKVPISSLKPMFGHCLGAVGGIGVVASVMALLRGFAPPTLHHTTCPPEYPWDFVPQQGREIADLDVVLSTNAAFGGNNTALLLRRSHRSRLAPETF